MNPREEKLALAGEYVLGLLSAAEAEDLERRMAEDAELRAAVREWREHFQDLDRTADPATPSPGLWRRIEADLDPREEAAGGASFGLAERLWSSLAFWRGAALAGAVASALFAVALATTGVRSGPQPIVIAVMQGSVAERDGEPASVIVEAFEDGSIRLVPLADMEVPQGRTLQVWTLWDAARGPVSVGLLDELRGARMDRGGLPPPRPEQIYEISLEPRGGSPTGRPTGPILFKGSAARPSL
jgi:anti-sigma-K factor RskA